jgi:uncharacterized membrane protein
MLSAESARVASRRRYIDWARGLAVLIMIEAHTLDAWTRTSSRHAAGFQYFSMLGGFAAPLFLWLAGLSLVLSAERTLVRTGQRSIATDAVVRRGAEIFILAFLFRLQAFVLSPGSWPVTIFRVDILNVMGPSIACAGLVWGLSRGRRRSALAFAVIATLIAMVTPLVRVAHWVDALPIWLQWHVRPFGDHTTFTLFPWAGFTFGGACCGVLLSTTRDATSERRLLLLLAVAGTVLLWFGFFTASRPSLYPVSSFWTTSPTFFAIRAAVLLLALSALYALSVLVPGPSRPLDVLESFGRNSLFIYWIHVELVYGYATWALHHRLPVWGTVVAYAFFTVLMYGAIVVKGRVQGFRREGRAQKSPSQAVPA